MNSILRQDVHSLIAGFRNRDYSSVQIAEAFLSHSKRWNKDLNVYIEMDESVLEKAKALDRARDEGKKLGPLAGIPFAAKDMFCTKGLRTTAGSLMLKDFVPPYSATVIERLEAAGALVLGKANQDEFAMGSSNESSYFGPCRNPWDKKLVPGGSSGGSAAAVAAGFAPFSLGTDTGGSIRQPASFCGVVGIKPTYGRVSRYGIVAFASSLDQAGPLTRTIRDAALVLEVMSGLDPRDSTTADEPVPPWSAQINSNLKGVRVGLPQQYFEGEIDPEVSSAVKKATQWVRSAGAEIVSVSIPLITQTVPVYYLICTSEASSNLARYDGVRYGYRSDFKSKPPLDLEDFYSRNRSEGFGAEVKRRIMLGTFALSSGYFDAYYLRASRVRRLLRNQFMEAFKQCDVLLGPVATTPAFALGERFKDPIQMYLNDIYTTSTNLAGLPGLSVPATFTEDGRPVGVQLTGRDFQEQTLFNVGQAIEEAAGIKERYCDVLR